MGAYVPRLVSPVTGHEEAAASARGFIFEPDEPNLSRWRRIRSYRIVALVWSVLLFGVFSVLTIWQQGQRLFE